MKYYIIAGEASGDLHGSNLIKEIIQRDPEASIRCWGGDMMEAAGATLVKHIRDLAFMGFLEVAMNLRTILANISFCKGDIFQFQPDVIILIDYPGFNLRIAEWGKREGFKIVYYISPQVWAWKENRVKKMRQCIDLMLVILPFEKNYFLKKWNWEVEYVGHPLVQVIDQYCQEHKEDRNFFTQLKETKLIALLPGSRKQELMKKLPIMLKVAGKYSHYKFVVAKAPGLEDNFYDGLLKGYTNVTSVRNQTYPLLLNADAALVTSGTATLETALFGVPEVICYKGSNVSYQIAKRLIKINYISLVNLIMDRPVVKELIQGDLTTNNIIAELNELLDNPQRREKLQKDYAELKEVLSEGGNASANAAEKILQFIK